MIGLQLRTAAMLLTVAVVILGRDTLAPPRVIAQVPGSVPSPGVFQPDLMTDLLTEVKGIRADVRDVARAGTRLQLLLGRVELQQLHLAHLDQRLAFVSARRMEAANNRMATSVQLRDLERQRLEDLSADERTAAESDRRRLKAQIQEHQSVEEQRRREESELANAMVAEEEALRQLTAQLDAWEGRLGQ